MSFNERQGSEAGRIGSPASCDQCISPPEWAEDV